MTPACRWRSTRSTPQRTGRRARTSPALRCCSCSARSWKKSRRLTRGGWACEVAARSGVPRRGGKDVCCGTNHFRTDELCVGTKCVRYPKLEASQKADGKLGVAEVAKALDSVNQGPMTVHAMVFEPK